jgi:hypothetical protein
MDNASVATTGEDLDLEGYTVSLDGGVRRIDPATSASTRAPAARLLRAPACASTSQRGVIAPSRTYGTVDLTAPAVGANASSDRLPEEP